MFLLVLASYYHVINVKMHFAVACLGRVSWSRVNSRCDANSRIWELADPCDWIFQSWV